MIIIDNSLQTELEYMCVQISSFEELEYQSSHPLWGEGGCV